MLNCLQSSSCSHGVLAARDRDIFRRLLVPESSTLKSLSVSKYNYTTYVGGPGLTRVVRWWGGSGRSELELSAWPGWAVLASWCHPADWRPLWPSNCNIMQEMRQTDTHSLSPPWYHGTWTHLSLPSLKPPTTCFQLFLSNNTSTPQYLINYNGCSYQKPSNTTLDSFVVMKYV